MTLVFGTKLSLQRKHLTAGKKQPFQSSPSACGRVDGRVYFGLCVSLGAQNFENRHTTFYPGT